MTGTCSSVAVVVHKALVDELALVWKIGQRLGCFGIMNGMFSSYLHLAYQLLFSLAFEILIRCREMIIDRTGNSSLVFYLPS